MERGANRLLDLPIRERPTARLAGRSLNVTDRIFDRSITGARDRKLFRRIKARLDASHNKVMMLVAQIEEYMAANNVQKLTPYVYDIMQLLTDQMSTAKELADLRESFIAFNGAQLLVELLFRFQSNDSSRSRETAARADVQFGVLALLREIATAVPSFAKGLAHDTYLLKYLFSLLRNRFLFDHAIGLIEELLCAREDVFDLNIVPNIVEMLKEFNARQLLYFCRIFVVTLHEPDDQNKSRSKMDAKSHVIEFLTHNLASKVRVVDRNQGILVDCKFILPRLMKLLKQHKFIANAQQLMQSLPASSLFQMLMNMQHDANDDWADGSASSSTTASDNTPTNPLLIFDQMLDDDDHEETNNTYNADRIRSTASAVTSVNTNSDQDEDEDADSDDEGEEERDDAETYLLEEVRRMVAAVDPSATVALMPRPANIRVENATERNNNDDAVNSSAPPTPAPAAGAAAAPQFSLRELVLSSLQIELMFSISALMSGKRKFEVQDQLASMDLPRTLLRIFASIPWVDPPGTAPATHVHGPQCDCKPENALRVQFLRMVLNFCDRDADNIANKLLLFSPKELEEMRPLLGARASLCQPALACVPPENNDDEGLMSKLVRFLQDPSSSGETNLRFWIGSCIEAALRGAEPAIQVFFAHRGIIKHLVSELIRAADRKLSTGPSASNNNHNSSSTVVLQTAFDLLSECVKFNSTVFELLMAELHSSERFTTLTQLCIENLVDSNVFVRSLVLSVNASKARNGGSPEAAFVKFAEFLGSSFVQLQKGLMDAITLENINTENLCCLNTSVILWMFERRKGRLVAATESVMSALSSSDRERIRGNYVQLLVFWREYYRLRDRDRQSLQFASGINFTEWMQTQEQLLEIFTGMRFADIRPQSILKELILLDAELN